MPGIAIRDGSPRPTAQRHPLPFASQRFSDERAFGLCREACNHATAGLIEVLRGSTGPAARAASSRARRGGPGVVPEISGSPGR